MKCCSLSVGHRTGYDEIAFQKHMQFHSPTIGCRKRCDEIAFQKHVQCHSPPIGHRIRYDEITTIWQENVQSHSHSVHQAQDILKLSFRKMWNVKCHSPTVDQTRCDKISFQ